MPHETFLLNSPGVPRLHAERWLPDETPRAVVLLAHGYAEHIGRYAHVANVLQQSGYAVYGVDYRGHGQSDGPRVYVESIEELTADFDRLAQAAREHHPDQPVFILGHSMGTVVTLTYVLTQPDPVAGLVLSGAPLAAFDHIPGFVLALVRWIRRIAPRTAFIPALPAEQICSDPDVVAAYQRDPLVYRGPWRTATLIAIADAVDRLRQRLGKLSVPLLVLHGEEDEVSPPAGADQIYERAGSGDKTRKTYPGMRHEILNETDRRQVLDDITQWLDAHNPA